MSNSSTPAKQGACVVIGAGDDTGGAIARAFAREGLISVLVRRPRNTDALDELAKQISDEGHHAIALGVDARDEDAMVNLFSKVETEIGPIEVAVFNIGANVNFPILDMTGRVFRKVWEMACFAGFLTGRESARHMIKRGRGTILFTGATASVRGGSGYSAFAGAKHALRALAQSLARELGPKNIHVAHVIIDGAIDSRFIRDNMANVDEARQNEQILSPDEIAANYVWLHKQARSAWTHELDLRPWTETW